MSARRMVCGIFAELTDPILGEQSSGEDEFEADRTLVLTKTGRTSRHRIHRKIDRLDATK